MDATTDYIIQKRYPSIDQWYSCGAGEDGLESFSTPEDATSKLKRWGLPTRGSQVEYRIVKRTLEPIPNPPTPEEQLAELVKRVEKLERAQKASYELARAKLRNKRKL